MTHPREEELIAYREGEAAENAVIVEHLRECADCREEFARLNVELEQVFAALDMMEAPDPGGDYGQRVWKEIAPKLAPWRAGVADDSRERVRWWQAISQSMIVQRFLITRRFAAFAGVAALVVVAFFAGRGVRRADTPVVTSAANMREKVLLLAVGEHLGRSEMVLTELANTDAKPGNARLINISAEQKRAEDLVAENRLYRQTAQELGDARITNVLDDLERVLLDVAHSPDEVTAAQLQAIRGRIDDGGLLFKVRVVGEELEERRRAAPAENDKLQKDRKKV
jgi:hypothetical protein